MTVVVEFTVPPTGLPGGEILTDHPGAAIELERVVPTDDGTFPFFWTYDIDPEIVRSRLPTEPEVDDIELLDDVGEAALFRAAWTPEADVVKAIKMLQATVIEATGTNDGWYFQVRAQNRSYLSEFVDVFRQHGTRVELQRVFDLDEKTDLGQPLTSNQREMLLAAFDEGYYDQPKQVTLEELGRDVGISARAVSNRLRRGTRNLIDTSLRRPVGRLRSN